MNAETRASHFILIISIAAILLLRLCFWVVAIEQVAAQAKDSSQAAVSPRSDGQISGQVLQEGTSEPVPDAEVFLRPHDEASLRTLSGNVRTVHSGEDGVFTFPGLPNGSYSISTSHNGFVPIGAVEVSLNSGQTIERIVLTVMPAGAASGNVVDVDGHPVAGLQVYALRFKYWRGGGREAYAPSWVLTDDQGNFRLANLSKGFYVIRAGGFIKRPMKAMATKETPNRGSRYSDTYFPGTKLLAEAQPVEISFGLETNNIRIPITTEKTYKITGMVVGAGNASGMKPSEVMITKEVGAVHILGDAAAAILADGTFTIRDVSPGDYLLTLRAFAKGEVTNQGNASVHVVDSDVQTRIEIGDDAEVRGKFEVFPGFSSAGKLIILDTAESEYYASKLDSDGAYDIRNIPPGEYTFGIIDTTRGGNSAYVKQTSCSGKDFASQPVELDVGTTMNCEVTLGSVATDAGIVSGQVTDGDKPIAGLVVVLIPQSRELRKIPRYTRTTQTDLAGRYEIQGAFPGDYFLLAVPPDNDYPYFALDYADRNQVNAERVSIDTREIKIVNPRPSSNR